MMQQDKQAKIQEDTFVQIFLILAKDAVIKIKSTPFQRLGPKWDWTCVTKVCRFWRTVALETANLWSYLDQRVLYSKRRTRKFLLLSKDIDLTVEYAPSGCRFSSLKTALKQMQRIRHLSIAFGKGLLIDFTGTKAAELVSLLKQPAPRAKNITLGMWQYSKLAQIALPVTSPGVLQEVDLSYLDFTKSSNLSSFSGLRKLSIMSCKNLSFSDLFEVLEVSLKLSSLTITHCNIHRSEISKSVYLPYLNSTDLVFDYFFDFYNLYRNLEAPNLLDWKISCIEELRLKNITTLNVLSKLPEEKCIFNGMSIFVSGCSGVFSWVNLKIYRKPLSPDSKENEFQLSFAPEEFHLAFPYLIDVFHNYLAKVESIDIQDLTDSLTVDNWRAIFRASVRVRTVEVELGREIHNGDGGMSCLKALNPVFSPEESEAHCPALDHLVIQWVGEESTLDYFLSTLEEMLKARSSRGLEVRKLSIRSSCVVSSAWKSKIMLLMCVQELECGSRVYSNSDVE